MRIDAVSIFPEYLEALDLSLIGKARREGLIDLRVHDLRTHTHDRHRSVDDTPYGGGAGMVMRAQPWSEALQAILDSADGASGSAPLLIVPGPSGERFTQTMAHDLAARPWLAFACGRYEGIDERVYEWAAERMEVRTVSLGDYVLNGGEVAVLAMVEAIGRLLPGVVGNAESLVEESHEGGLLEYPVYTKPAEWDGRAVPPVLLGGDHAKIASWRHQQRVARTAERRPDLLPASSATGALADLEEAVAGPADAPEIALLQRACWAPVVADPARWWGAPAESAQDVIDALGAWTTRTFRADGRLVASVRVRRHPEERGVWEIGRLMVVPDLQGRALGREILGRAESLAPDEVTSFRLNTAADQPDLRRFYRKAGYRPVGPGAGPDTIDLVKPRP